MSSPQRPASLHSESLSRREFCGRSLAAVAAGATLPAWATAPEPGAAGIPGDRRWELFVIQHSHIDLGFTDRQEVIADYHRGFVRQAIRMALSPQFDRRHRDRNRDADFKYTIEGFWSLEQFLRDADARGRRALRRALDSGRIELTAGYFHLTELLDEELLRSTLQPAQRFAREEGLTLDTCMSCDVNGFSWGFCELLAEYGVRYLSTNINPHHGGVPLGRPLTPFYWESPSGKRVLVWSGLPYHRANVLGLMGYYSPDTDLGFPGLQVPATHRYLDVRDLSLAEAKLLPALAHLERHGYPYDFLPLMGNALYTDNGPAGLQACDLIAQWNRRHGDRIHIRTATLGEFFRHLEQSVPNLPTHRGEWTDWWSDGVAATPLDTLLFRNAQRTRHLLRRLDPHSRVISPERLDAIDRRLALYAEHTFGYSDTSSHSLLTHQVFTRKSAQAILADELAGQALVEVQRRRGEGEFSARRPFTYQVINPLNRPVRATLALPTDYWEAPVVADGVRVLGPHGTSLPCQVQPSPRGRTIIARMDLPADADFIVRVEANPGPAPQPPLSNTFANAFYRAAWDETRGLHSLVDAASGAELLTPGHGGLGSPVYQLFPGGRRGDAAGFGYTTRTIPRDEITPGRCTGARRVEAGEVFERWEFSYAVPGTLSCVLAFTFYRDLPHLELAARILKTEVTDPEGLYLAFPFAVDGGIWHLDKPGAPIRPGLDQLPGSCCDYYCLQAGAALAGPGGGIAWTTLDAPLVHLGKLRLWNYSTSIEPTGPIFSWLTNNKWETNFRLSCGGRYEFRYVIHPSPAFSNPSEALTACRDHQFPPVVLRH